MANGNNRIVPTLDDKTGSTFFSGGNESAPPENNSEIVKEAVRRTVKEYGEVLRRLADE